MKDLRQNYTKGELLESKISNNPFELFTQWFSDAQSNETLVEVNAMVLSTVNEDAVDSRIVLLKSVRKNQFVFFTNFESNKGKQLLSNPNCSLLFPWIAMERQIIVRGKAVQVSEQESNEYFLSRPRSSQIGAWVSAQSSEIDSRESLDRNLKNFEVKYESEPIQKPLIWGGFAVEPSQIEFWQGRENRLHDRILFTKRDGVWGRVRLQP